MIKNILFVALGGALGSVMRYLLTAVIQEGVRSNFPCGTMTVNVLGCLLIGFITALGAVHGVISPQMKLVLTTGFCGGFTTFSTFMNETLSLTHSGSTLTAAVYVAASITAGFIAAVAGMKLGGLC